LLQLAGQAPPILIFMTELKEATNERLKTVDLKVKQRDFEHLLFNRSNTDKIIRFGSFMNALKE